MGPLIVDVDSHLLEDVPGVSNLDHLLMEN